MKFETYENGTEVLIFGYVREWGLNQDFEHFKRGTIIESKISEDCSYHGAPTYVINYTVLGEDGKEYFGNYKHPVFGDSFFMTKEDYTLFLNNKIKHNEKRILEIQEDNKQIEEIINHITNKEIDDKTLKNTEKKDSVDLVVDSQTLNERYVEYAKVFTNWLYDITKEEDMTVKEQEIVKYFQLFLEQQIPERTIRYYMDHFRFYEIDDFIDRGIELTSKIINVDKALINAKALCIKKVEQKETNKKVYTKK